MPLIPFNYQAAAGGVPAAFAAGFDEPWIINGLTWMSVKQAEADRGAWTEASARSRR